MNIITKPKSLYKIMTIAATIGFMASFMQMLEKLTLLANPQAILVCNINSVFSCTNILNSWQSSVFGFPNALMCIIFFVTMLIAGIIGWTSGVISKNLRLILFGMTLFFVGFGFWYLWQSIFIISSMCIYCIGCYGGVLGISFAWFRLNHHELPVSKNIKKTFEKLISKSADSLLWISIATIILIEIIEL